MKALSTIGSSRLQSQSSVDSRRPHPTRFAAITFGLVFIISASGFSDIGIEAPSRITIPPVESTGERQVLHCDQDVLRIVVTEESIHGWRLGGEVYREALIGQETGFEIPAQLFFESVKWVRGGSGSQRGIRISPDAKAVEADPGYGIGEFEISFKVRFEIPPFPITDYYYGVSTFTLL